MSEQVTAMAVVVPAHNEESLLLGCLTALTRAVERTRSRGIACVVRIVLDACTDGSETIAQSFEFPVLRIDEGRVGVARAVGIADALHELRDVAAHDVWIANTDADSEVPSQWLLRQRALSARADVCVGTVRPDFADLTPDHRAHWLATHPRGVANGHVHGANLGVRSDVYAALGGFAPWDEHEDVDLVDRARMAGARIMATADIEVMTSGRLAGRTPGGYAGYLRDQARQLFGSGEAQSQR